MNNSLALRITIRTDEIIGEFEIPSNSPDGTVIELVKDIYAENQKTYDLSELNKLVISYINPACEDTYVPVAPNCKLSTLVFSTNSLLIFDDIEYLRLKYLKKSGIDEDMLLARLPSPAIPVSLTGEARINRIFDELRNNNRLNDLIVLAFLRWSTDEIIKKMLVMLLNARSLEQNARSLEQIARSLEQIAPMALRSLRTEHIKQLQKVWQEHIESLVSNDPPEPTGQKEVLANQNGIGKSGDVITNEHIISGQSDELRVYQLVDELVKCFNDIDDAKFLLENDVGFPRSGFPDTQKPSKFWWEIWTQLKNGRVKDGFQKLQTLATAQFPENKKFREIERASKEE